jgi:hypothetical protein
MSPVRLLRMRLISTTTLTRRRVLTTRSTKTNKETDVKTPVPRRRVPAVAAMHIHMALMGMKDGIGLVQPVNSAVRVVLNIADIVLPHYCIK